jgi:hypothetical protein
MLATHNSRGKSQNQNHLKMSVSGSIKLSNFLSFYLDIFMEIETDTFKWFRF